MNSIFAVDIEIYYYQRHTKTVNYDRIVDSGTGDLEISIKIHFQCHR